MKKIPIFFINGQLDSGKTTYILDTLKEEKDLCAENRMLFIVCEQGEVEYDEIELAKYNAVVKYFENFEDWDYKVITQWIKEEKPKRIVIEMNGMWDITKLQFPSQTEIIQSISFIDGSTFEIYFNNMRQQMTDMIKQSNIVCFTKVNDPTVLEHYKDALKIANRNCDFYVLDEFLRAKPAFIEPLPYDLDAEVVQIKDEDYVTFYIDTFDNKDRYNDKIVEYEGQVILSDKLPENTFIIGRMVMNCCANDVQLYGFFANSNMGMELKDRSYIHIKGRITYEWSTEYQEEELIIHPIDIYPVADKEEVINLTNNQ